MHLQKSKNLKSGFKRLSAGLEFSCVYKQFTFKLPNETTKALNEPTTTLTHTHTHTHKK